MRGETVALMATAITPPMLWVYAEKRYLFRTRDQYRPATAFTGDGRSRRNLSTLGRSVTRATRCIPVKRWLSDLGAISMRTRRKANR